MMSVIPFVLALGAAVGSSNAAEDGPVLRDPALSLAIPLHQPWVEGSPADARTDLVINWPAPSGALVASCSLQTVAGTETARIAPAEIEARARDIVLAILGTTQAAASAVTLVEASTETIGTVPVVYLVRDVTLEAGGRPAPMRVWTLATVRRGREIYLECASTVPKDPTLEPAVVARVEEEVRRMLWSVRFEDAE